MDDESYKIYRELVGSIRKVLENMEQRPADQIDDAYLHLHEMTLSEAVSKFNPINRAYAGFT